MERRRVRITNDSLNQYGTRILTSGMDIDQYRRNPVLLYMHVRGQVIGYIKDITVKDGEVLGTPVFDDVTDLSKTCHRQWDFGSLKMVSAGVEILEMSEDPQYLVQGQTRPTITRSRLYEVSIVDIGANDDAIRLMKDGRLLELSADGQCGLPMLSIENQTPNTNKTTMNENFITKLALLLGLAATADEQAVEAAVTQLVAKNKENETLRQQLDTLTLAVVTQTVEQAVSEKKITAANKQHFIDLGKAVGLDSLNATFAAMSPMAHVTDFIGQGGKQKTALAAKSWDELDKEGLLLSLKECDPECFKAKYKERFGVEYK